MVELAGVVILGILAQWLAWRIRVPAILPLIVTGLLIGPVAEYSLGYKLINPSYDGDSHSGIFAGNNLFYFVSLAIGVILFEGGLTLKRKEIKGVGGSILKLITIGSLVTFIGGGLAAHYILDIDMSIAFLFAGLIIVTGPTVIAPILRNVPLNHNVSTILKWEGILIDPIGALVAVLVYEFINAGVGAGEFTLQALVTFLQVVITGIALGIGAALALAQLIKKELIPHYLLNSFTLAFVLGIFVLSDVLAHESGLLAVVVMGMRLANSDVPRLKEILDFKESITVLLISILFILLSANMNIEQLSLLGVKSLLLFLVVVFILRPLGVFLSTASSDLTFREKLFISWVGPRGIVAAGIASLFGILLMQKQVVDAEMLTPLVFLIVLGTVLLNATTARLMARLLGVTLEQSQGVLIVGANNGSRILAKFLQDNGRHVVLVDSNEESIKISREMGLEAFQDNIFNDGLQEHFELLDMGYLMAMTSNDEVNQYACRKFQPDFGENGSFRLATTKEVKDKDNQTSNTLFGGQGGFLKFNDVARDFDDFHEIAISSHEHLEELFTLLKNQRSLPVFIKKANTEEYEVITATYKSISLDADDKLVYFGQPLMQQEFELEEVIENQ